jgi:hypothetical protein
MKRWHMNLMAAMAAGIACMALGAAVSADEKAAGPKTMYTFWAMPAQGAGITVLAQGSEMPKTIEFAPTTIIDGMCVHCLLPLKFKATEGKKNCMVCGCAVSNAECIAGKPVKGSAETIFQGLPRGAALRLVYNEVDKPESGIKTVFVDFNSVYLPVDGLAGQTPAQLASLVKQVGGTKPELVDNDKRMTFTVKDGWIHETAAKFAKVLAKVGAKISQPEVVAAK